LGGEREEQTKIVLSNNTEKMGVQAAKLGAQKIRNTIITKQNPGGW
jgi:hypothetical protein